MHIIVVGNRKLGRTLCSEIKALLDSNKLNVTLNEDLSKYTASMHEGLLEKMQSEETPIVLTMIPNP